MSAADTGNSPETLARDGAAALEEIDLLRAGMYALLSNALLQPVKSDMLNQLGQLQGDDSPLGMALTYLASSARHVEDTEEEYTLLFYGSGQGGEMLPYASYYLTGSLNDKPLADLRDDLAAMELGRGALNDEPEDHIGYLFDIMHCLIVGRGDFAARPLDQQQAFFQKHIAPWADAFFTDLEAAESASFYVGIAQVGRAFMMLEDEAFQLAA